MTRGRRAALPPSSSASSRAPRRTRSPSSCTAPSFLPPRTPLRRRCGPLRRGYLTMSGWTGRPPRATTSWAERTNGCGLQGGVTRRPWHWCSIALQTLSDAARGLGTQTLDQKWCNLGCRPSYIKKKLSCRSESRPPEATEDGALAGTVLKCALDSDVDAARPCLRTRSARAFAARVGVLTPGLAHPVAERVVFLSIWWLAEAPNVVAALPLGNVVWPAVSPTLVFLSIWWLAEAPMAVTAPTPGYVVLLVLSPTFVGPTWWLPDHPTLWTPCGWLAELNAADVLPCDRLAVVVEMPVEYPVLCWTPTLVLESSGMPAPMLKPVAAGIVVRLRS
ncbi:hypothetical protein DFJ74DRAFT_29998 [Hyaloraphidium curvatum]|nr:hypothetical protein DFJ74DRAFT_29782 [Hyaloraphidium curvatum]KAI9026185.1 hypothetical protein DFJ74DRAFT_29998 [Hyaloraphidium curvatum]